MPVLTPILRRLPFFVILLTFFACNRNSPDLIPSYFSKQDTLIIPLPSHIAIPDNLTSWNYHNGNLAFCTPDLGGYIQVNTYLAGSGKWLTTTLYFEGPDQIYSEGNIAFANDSVFYFFPHQRSVMLTFKLSGKILNQYAISANSLVSYYLMNKNPAPGFTGNRIGFDISEHYSLAETETFEKAKLYGFIDTVSGKFVTVINYPEEFRGSVWSPNSVGRNTILLADTLYVNFVKSGYIYRYNLTGELIDKHLVRLPEINEMRPGNIDPTHNLVAFEMAGYYPKIVYDKWRHVFYRFAVYYDTPEKATDLQGFISVARNRVLAIITFNRNMEIVGTDKFPLKNYGLSEKYYFVSEKGLHLFDLNNREENLLRYITLIPGKQ